MRSMASLAPDGARGIRRYRGVPDVAADASASSGLGLVVEVPSRPVMGTSSGTALQAKSACPDAARAVDLPGLP